MRAPTVDDVVGRMRAAAGPLTPFGAEVTAFAADLSRALRRDPVTRADPAVAALAYWIRPAHLVQLQQEWQIRNDRDDRIVRVPRGVVFHIPPTNVDTLFVYSWLLSALAGNANVIRLSPSVESTALLRVIDDVLAQHPIVAGATVFVRYGHDDARTAELSTADVRVIWGGDDTVAAIRRVPLAPHATELVFPDRFSFALLDASAVRTSSEAELKDLATRFFNDAYWFDQLGCASPRLVVWRGDRQSTAAAAERFYDALAQELVRREHTTATGAVIAKLVHAADSAAAGRVESIVWDRSDLTIAQLRALDSVVRDGPGGGLFYDVRIEELSELAAHVVRRDQTLTHYGFSAEELRALARTLNGRGVDRLVPVGQALTFDRFWDGYDLLGSFTRCVVVDPVPQTLAAPAARADQNA